MYVAVTRLTAPKERLERMAQGFKHAAPTIKDFPGCIGFELWVNDTTLEAISRWESKEAVEAYAKSDLFTAHHPGATAASSEQGAGAGAVEYFDGEVIF